MPVVAGAEVVRPLQDPVEMVAADAHLGYYLKGLFVERLREDVVRPDLDPARPRPWLAGSPTRDRGGSGVQLDPCDGRR